jgi:DNA-directed RNA polymerase subunit beta'
LFDVNNFEAIKIGLASPEKIREWSYGEVRKPETINYRTLKPERDGLFCERIFGPVKDWECHCGKYKRIRFKGIVCDKCGVEVTRSKVRRERMGHIELATPVSHIWYLKGVPSRIGLLLDMTPRALEKVIYFANYIVIDPGKTPLMKRQLLTEQDYREACEKYGQGFKAGMGAEAIREFLREIDIEKLYQELHREVRELTGQKRSKAIKRLEVVDAFRKSGNKPEWMILECIPVIPPELRPMVQLDGGRFATSDLNDLYRRVINRNNRLKRLLELGAPDIIVKNEKRMLQEAVDALIDNGRRGRPVTGPNNRPLKSLSDMLKGKQGRFRQNLLGKRVDYSGRSVIVVGPTLKLHQCGFPKEMALELFKPFVMKTLVERQLAPNIKAAKKMVERVNPQVWDILEEVIKDHPILLNRAPTLHRLGIQAFEPVLVDGKAIQIHPLVCTPYNADFDGDQMAVHLPLSAGAIAEARVLMLSAHNILSPAYGNPLSVPTQEMVIGSYWLTCERPGMKGEGKVFDNPDEVYMAYENGDVHLHARIKFNLPPEKFDPKSAERPKYIDTTVGRVIFNFSFPSDVQLPYMNYTIDKKKLAEIVARCYRLYGTTKTAAVLDALKTLGFKFATISGSTIAISDIDIPPDKPAILAQAEKEEGILEAQYRKGLITEEERRDRMIAIWEKASDSVKDAMLKHLDPMNPVYMMAISGARGNISQVRQLAGMRGLMADPSGRIIPLPIKANLREGLTVLEYFISTHGARKGLADTALRTADSGYLTRRLIDVTQDIIVREEDCGSTNYIEMEALVDIGREGKVINEIVTLRERIVGRTSAEDIYFEGKELLCKANQEITEEIADRILEAGFTKVKLRSVLTCQSRYGVCAKCYGRNLATGLPVDIGETVGIIAAQSIGEPGTQLTLRTFHTGGIATEDIIQGLPRVEELFEARKPKTCGVLSETKGVVRIVEEKGHRKVIVVSPDGVEHAYPAPYGVRLKVQNGQMVDVGDQITEGPLNPHEILRIRGVTEVQRYLVDEVQRVYRSQGVDINDKHIEVIVRQMLRKVRVDEPGDTELLPGGLVDIFEFEDENKRVLKAKGKPAKGRPVLLGVTKASLACNSFLSAASFQETTRVLTEAAIKGKVDPLLGLKENVIIGKLIPAGTGMSRYRDIEVVTDAGTPPPLISLPEVPVVETPTYLDEDGRQKQEVGKSRRESKTKD